VSAPDGPCPTSGAPRTLLEELLQEVRRELARRDEDPTGAWVEESAADLARGTRPGWFLPRSAGGGLVFYARSGGAAYAHLHTEGGTQAARRLAQALLSGLPADIASLDLGFTGLSPEAEQALVAHLAEAPGSTVIERQAMERPLTPADGRLPAEPPPGLERVPVRAVTLEALAELDRQAFQGSVDELLVGAEPEANRRAMEALLQGRVGRFLDEASCAILASDPTRLLGAVLSAERSSRRAIVGALMVSPSERRRGLGRYLFGWTLRALWALGYESARLWVSVDNSAAVGLYRAFGLRESLFATIYRWDRPSPTPQPHEAR
jgi:ribosomal protein S18 acetylase RimI-like enzyme